MKQLVYIAFLIFFSNGFGQDTLNYYDQYGIKHGHWINYGKDVRNSAYPDSTKVEEGNYINGAKEGIWIKYYIDGKSIKLIGEFKKNRPSGNYSKYYENGSIKETGKFNSKTYFDSLIQFYENGQKKYCAFYDSLGKEKGVVQYFYSNGQLKLSYNALNGTPKGTSTRFYENGDLMETIEYDTNGLELKSNQYEMKNPPIAPLNSTKKSPSDIPKDSGGVFPDFNPNGNNKIYNENGDLLQDGFFKNGQLWSGKVFVYGEDGILIRVKIYKEGAYHSDVHL